MIPVGMGLAWVGYVVFFYGYSLVKGYDLSFSEIVSPVNFYQGDWPPPEAPNDAVLPAGHVSAKKKKK
jgi:hypothetical protein